MALNGKRGSSAISGANVRCFMFHVQDGGGGDGRVAAERGREWEVGRDDGRHGAKAGRTHADWLFRQYRVPHNSFVNEMMKTSSE